MNQSPAVSIFLVTAALLLSACSAEITPVAEQPAAPASPAVRNEDPLYSPTAERDYPTSVYWGDTHLHTNFSMDAYIFGTKLGPDDAYRFARGETIMATHGQPARLDKPLDFLVIADHSDALGAMLALEQGDELLMQNETLASWRNILSGDDSSADHSALHGVQTSAGLPKELDAESVRLPAWKYLVDTAEKYYQPGVFTPLIGFEWTATLGGQNLHRVVIYRDDAEEALALVPLSSTSSSDPRRLWQFLERYEEVTGGRALAIPHNGNLSNGIMFPLAELEFGDPMDAEYVTNRARWERVYEVTQIKGDGETHPFLSPDDEFADYETWALGDFAGVPKTNDMLFGEYAREALKQGLRIEAEFGVNPYQFGMIGSTDSHTSLPAVDENNFFGKHSLGLEPSPERWNTPVGERDGVVIPGWLMTSSGYAAVWARDNTREEIWDALHRREVYASTGPRITLRFFGGWNFTEVDAQAPDIAAVGYVQGVPMGAELTAGAGQPPRFLIRAMKEVNGANLDRIQVIKGWTDAEGLVQERVYEVAWSNTDTRRPDEDGKLPPIGSTVDIASATYDNSLGSGELSVVWTDPDFDAQRPAFYYVRVLQIPTPRWTTHDAVAFGITIPPYVPKLTQERAYSSPIWYRPD